MPAPRFPFNISYVRMWRECLPYTTKAQRRTVLLYNAVYILAVGIDLMQPLLLGRLVNTLQTGGPNLLREVAIILGLIVACSLGFWSLHGPARVTERKLAQDVYIKFTTTAYTNVTELPLRWHQDHHSGALINRITTAGMALRTFMENGFISIQNIGTLAGALAMLCFFNPAIGALSLLAFICSMAVITKLNHRMVRALQENNEARHAANATFYDFVSNITSIIVLRLQNFSRGALEKKLQATVPTWMIDVKINEWRWFAYAMMNVTAMAAILLGYIYINMRNGVPIAAGALVSIYMYQDRVGRQAAGFLSTQAEWLRHLASMESTKSMFRDHAALARPVPEIAGAWNTLALRGLSFGSRLDNISLALRKGERVALIGGSGGGKTTLLSMLRGLHEPDSAELFIDGRKAAFSALAGITTLVPQDPEVFENTIRFNVGFGLEGGDEAVMESLRMAEFTQVLHRMPQGLDTDIREKGVNLSVGQKQRLALARGLFAAETSDIILLDEPTSSVDLPTEERIFRHLFAKHKDKTIVATLHRLHLLPLFDRIIYLDHGRLVADWPTAEALRRAGPIRDVYAAYQQNQAQQNDP